MGEWKETRLGALMSFVNGRTSPERQEHLPFPVYGSNGIIGYSSEFNAAESSLIIGRVGSYCGSVYLSRGRCWVTDNAIRAEAEDQNDPRFLFYLLGSLGLNNWRAGSGQPLLNQSILSSIDVRVPEPDSQHRIAHILGTLDDKIELNRRMNRTLEKTAAALFKSWFIDFDPVRAKADGRDTGLPAEVAHLFPDTFEDSDLGPIPKGWTAGVVGDIAKQAIGGQWGGDSHDEGTVPAICLRGCDMDALRASGYAPKAPIRFVKRNAIKTRLPSECDVLVAASGAGPCGRPLWCSSRISDLYQHPVIYSNFVKRFTTPSPAHAVYLDRFLIGKFNDRTIHDYINGTSVPNLDASGLLRTCKLLLPPNGVIHAFSAFCQFGFQRLYSGQSATLARMRDTLLPKLMSGEIEVPDLEQAAGRAV